MLLLVPLPHYALRRAINYFTKDAAGPAPFFLAQWGQLFLLGFLVSFGLRVYDYARFALILAPAGGSLRAFARGVAFTWRYGRASFLLWLALFVPPLLLPAGFALVTAQFPPESLPGVGLQFALGQLVILVRIAGGIAALGAQLRFLRAFFT